MAEQGRKTGVGIESRPAQPVDRAITADKGRRLTIADQPVIFDSAGQSGSPSSAACAQTLLPRPLAGRSLQPGRVHTRRNLIDAERHPPPPVRMLVNGAGDVGMLMQTQETFESAPHQARSRASQKLDDGVEAVVVNAMLAERLV